MISKNHMAKYNLRRSLKFALGFVLSAWGTITSAQSDLCANAISIPVESSYQTQAYNLTGFANDGPALYTGTSSRDGWFTFTTGNEATAVMITAIGDANFPIALSTYLDCADLAAQSSLVPGGKTAVLYASVTANTTYLLRISRMSSGPAGSTGVICVQSINAAVNTYTAGDLNTDFAAIEPDANSTSACPGSMSLSIPAGNAIITVSTFYSMRASNSSTMQQQRSLLSSPTTSTGEVSVSSGAGDATATYKYERHNLSFAEGAMGTVEFNLHAWRTSGGSDCNTTFNKVSNYTWTVVAFYEAASSCPSPSIGTFQTLSYTTTSASLSWNAPTTAPTEGYEYVYSTSNTAPTGSGTPLVSGTQINLNSLSVATNYYLFVRGKCSATEFGTWTGPYHFNTAACNSNSQCNYQLQMNNTTPSGWNGTIISFIQSGVVAATATLLSGNSQNISVPLCDNLSTEISVQHVGSFSDEISFTLYDASGNAEYTHASGGPLVTNEVLHNFTSACPDCQSPSALNVTYPGSSAVNISWTAPIAAPANGYEYIVSTSSTTPIVAGTAVPTGTSALATGLDASSNYYVFVRSVCSLSEASSWAGPLAITTSCSESTLTVNEGLNSTSPSCWETEIVVDGNSQSDVTPELVYTTTSTYPTGLNAFEGSGYLRFNSYNCDNGDQVRLISTPFETTGLSAVDVDFKWSHDADFFNNLDGVQVQYSFDRSNWVNAGSFIPRFSPLESGWWPKTVELPAAVIEQTHVYVAFLFTSHGGNDCHIDNILLRETPSCKFPTNIIAAHVTQDFCRVEWDASASNPSNGYEWELRTSGAAGSGAVGLIASGNSSISDLFAEVNGLTSLTQYTIYVRSNCGAEQSDWSWPVRFRTVSDVINNFPFDETFETSSTTRPGWINEHSYGVWNWSYANGAGGGDVTTAHTGDQNARFRATSDITYTTKLVSPPLDLTILPAGAKLKFWFANQSWNGRQNELRVYYKTSYGNAWTLIPTAVYTSNQNSWTEVSLTLPQTGSDYYIAFEAFNKNSRGIVIDDVRIEPIECPIPMTNAVTGQNSAFIHWETASDPSLLTFEWELRTAGEPGSGNAGLKTSAITEVGQLGRNIAGLTANTTYHLYARTVCGVDDYSLWSDAFTFTTTTIAAPSNDHFSSPINMDAASYVYPNCMQVQGTTTGATPFFHQDYNDVWYRFTAISNGASIQLSNAAFDGAIVLMDAQRNIIDSENITSNGQTEILNVANLNAGEIYYISVANFLPTEFADGAFSICLKQLRTSKVNAGSFNLCSVLKASDVKASTYTYTFTPTGETLGGTTSITTSVSGNIFGNPQLSLAWGGTYSVKVDANYFINDGGENIESLIVPGVLINEITIVDAPTAQLNPNQSCENNVTLFRNNYIKAYGVSQGYICGVVNYTVEFTPVGDCTGSNPNFDNTFYVNTSGTLSLSYAFNSADITIEGNAHAGYWRVRWRPNFQNGPGQFGPEQVIKVNNTSSSPQGMAEYNSSELQANLASNIATAVYPNPNIGSSVNINIVGATSEIGFIKILDPVGRTVHQSQHTMSDSYSTQINFTQKLSAGLYVIEYNLDGVVKKDKLLIIE